MALDADFQCPDEPGMISRAVHLARLTGGYPGCRRCPHRDDVEGLSSREQKKIPAPATARTARDFLGEETVVGEPHGGFDPALVGRFAAGFGMLLRQELPMGAAYPTVVLASDGRPGTQRHLAETAERLRWVGCDLVDLGTVPCPALSWSMAEQDFDGGLYLGNPPSELHTAGIRFFRRGAVPLVGAEALGPICARAESFPTRPVRTSGKASKLDAMGGHIARFAESFHALRPLRFQLHTTCRPVGVILERLLANTACRMVLHCEGGCDPRGYLAEDVGHFGAEIDDDGCRCRLWDERGAVVPFEQLFVVLACRFSRREPDPATIVLEEGCANALAAALDELGFQICRCAGPASELHEVMAAEKAALGADARGRIWYAEPGGPVAADALGTLTLLLGILSEDDRPLSEVLDAGVTGH